MSGDRPVGTRHDRAAFLTVLAAIAATAVPNTILLTSLETLRADLHTSLATVSWVQVLPGLAFAVGTPIFGKIGDIVGARRVMVVGLALTVGFAFLTVGAWNVGSLIALRTLAQLTSAAVAPAGFSVLMATYTGDERARRLGAYSAANSISPVMGVAIGGPLVQWIGWRAMFALQGVVALVAFVSAVLHVPDTGLRRRPEFDVAGALLLASGVGSLLFVVNRVHTWGIGHPMVLGGAVAGPVLLGVLAHVERRRKAPLLPLEYLARPVFRRLLLLMFLTQGGYFVITIITPVLLQRHFGYGVALAGYFVMLRPFAYSGGSWTAGRLRAGWGGRRLQVFAASMAIVAAGTMSVGASLTAIVLVVLALVLQGAASGIAVTSVFTSVGEAVDVGDAGVGNGLAAMMNSLGQATGSTVGAAIVGDAIALGPFQRSFLLSGIVAGVALLTAIRLEPTSRRGRVRAGV